MNSKINTQVYRCSIRTLINATYFFYTTVETNTNLFIKRQGLVLAGAEYSQDGVKKRSVIY